MTKHLMKNPTLSKGLILMVLLCLFVSKSNAQQDQLFYFAAPDISSGEGDSPIYLEITSYDNPANVVISQPANVGFTPISVSLTAFDHAQIDLTAFLSDIESPAANIVSDNGLKIVSDENISVFYAVSAGSSKEIFSLKGTKGLGTNFYTPMQEFWSNGSVSPGTFSSIEIVASEDNTTVLITPRTAITGHAEDATFSVVLQEGETYSARDMNLAATTSLSGSIVSSDKPVAVTIFSGALSNSGCTSSFGDQITTADVLGKSHIVHRGTASNEHIFIMATQNGTSVSINDGTSTTTTLLNWGETFSYAIAEDINYVTSTKPVYVLHGGGNGCNIGGAQVPKLLCAGKYDQNFSRFSSDSLGIIVYTRSGFEGDFTINGSPTLLTAGDFSVVPGTSGEFVVARKYFNTSDIPVGGINTITNTEDVFGLGIFQGSSANGSGYAYLSEFTSYPFVEAGPAEDTVCANVNYPIAGIVGGGSVTGNWGSTGFGSFSSSLSTLDNIYIPSNLDSIVTPIELILSSTGPCPVQKDTIILHVQPAPVVNAGANQVVCANNVDVTLDGAVIAGSTTGIWTSLGSGTFAPDATTLDAIYTPSGADISAGTVTLVLTSTGAALCNTVTDTMVVTITPEPVVDAGPDTLYVCENNPNFSLTGAVSGGSTTGKWTTSGNGSFSPDNLSLSCDYTPSPTDVSGGEITIYLTSTGNGSCFPAKDSIKVIFTPGPSVNAGADILTCLNAPEINLNGIISGPTTTGIWTGGAGSFAPSDTDLGASYIPTASEISSGSITLILTSTDNGDCIAENDAVQINFVAPPFANYNYTEVCLGDTTIFTDFSLNGFGSIVNWDWDFGDGSSSSIQNPIHFFPDYGAIDVTLIVTSDAGCSDTITQSVPVHELPTADFTYEASCDDDLVIIDFTDNSSTSTENIDFWFYDFGGQGSQATQNPSQLFVGYGDFVITQIVKTEFGCVDTIVKIVEIPPRPEAGFFYYTPAGFNVGAQFEFTDTSYYSANWYWDFGNGETSFDQDPSTVYFVNGTYTVTQIVTGPLGCVDSVSTDIIINTVTNEINQLIPNAISPNGDGKNDVWKLKFIPLLYPDAQVIVMNRWGQTLYESIGYTEPWDGTYNGELVPEGSYFYIIKLSDEEVYKGSILVLISSEE